MWARTKPTRRDYDSGVSFCIWAKKVLTSFHYQRWQNKSCVGGNFSWNNLKQNASKGSILVLQLENIIFKPIIKNHDVKNQGYQTKQKKKTKARTSDNGCFPDFQTRTQKLSKEVRDDCSPGLSRYVLPYLHVPWERNRRKMKMQSRFKAFREA